MKDKDIVAMAKEELSKMKFFGGEILDSVVIRVKKAYPAYFDSYKEIDKIRNYLNEIDNLYCIRMIKNDEHNLDELWNINIDKSYQEEK